MLRVRQCAREHRSYGAVDGRENLAAAQHARGAALRDKDAIRRQLALDHVAVKLLGVQLQKRQPNQRRCKTRSFYKAACFCIVMTPSGASMRRAMLRRLLRVQLERVGIPASLVKITITPSIINHFLPTSHALQ